MHLSDLQCDCAACARYWAEEANVHQMDCDCGYCRDSVMQAADEEYWLRHLADPSDGWPTEGPPFDTVVEAAE